MQTKSNINWKKMLQGVSLAAFIAAPAFGATGISQAAPPDHAPAYGYRDRNNRDNDEEGEDDDNDKDDDDDYRDRDDRDRNDRDWNDRDWNDRDRNYRDRDDNFYNSTRSLEGVVVNDLRGRDFVLRLQNGRSVRVQLNEREPKRLIQGNRVQVQGYFEQTNRDNRSNTRYNENQVFRATNVRILRNKNGNSSNYNGRRTLNGIVTNVRSDQSFTFSAMNRSFDVSSTSRLPRGFSRGDIVSVFGDVRENAIFNARVTRVRNGNNTNGNYGYGNSNGGGYNNSNSNKNVNFPATVLDSNERNGTLRVRGEDGREYTVRTKEADNWSRGDRVRIQGRTQNGIVIAEDIDKR